MDDPLHTSTPEKKETLSLTREARLFSRLRTTLAKQTVMWMLGHARLRLAMVCILSTIFWALLFGLFFEGFLFVNSLHDEIIPLLFNVFFASLMAMIIFSSCILTYGGLYISSEAKFLLTLPVSAESIFSHKFKSTTNFSRSLLNKLTMAEVRGVWFHEVAHVKFYHTLKYFGFVFALVLPFICCWYYFLVNFNLSVYHIPILTSSSGFYPIIQ